MRVSEKNLVNLVSIACLVGFFGDALLQVSSKYLKLGGPTGWGLHSYFLKHGHAESLFVASGMMTLFYVLYIYLFHLSFLKFPITYVNVSLFGIVIDLIFRQFVIFSSLDGYYKYFNYFWSAVWMAIPMMLPLFIYNQLREF
jgi:uncharacterized membrane protein YvlD (DUF360 family)